MLIAPAWLGMRASAGARASSAASVSDVWAVLAQPRRWAQFDPFIRGVAPSPAADAKAGEPRSDDTRIAAGQRLLAQLRLLPFTVPVEVDHVVNRSSVAVTARLLPGLAEEVEHLVIPSANGGTLVTVRITLHGPLALPALLPRWLFRSLTVRLLARAAANQLRDRTREVSSVA